MLNLYIDYNAQVSLISAKLRWWKKICENRTHLTPRYSCATVWYKNNDLISKRVEMTHTQTLFLFISELLQFLLEFSIESNHIIKYFRFMKFAVSCVEQKIHPVATYLHCHVCRGRQTWLHTADIVKWHGKVSRSTKVPVCSHAKLVPTFQQCEMWHTPQWIHCCE